MNGASLGSVLAVLSLTACAGVQAACEPLISRGAVIYGGLSHGSAKGAGVVCGRQARLYVGGASDKLLRSSKGSEREHHEPDRESAKLILDRELASAQRQLEALRAKGEEPSAVEQQAMHRLELDVQALQREIARHQTR